MNNEDARTEIDYTVKDPKHEHEKPYAIRYDTRGTIPRTNLQNETHTVTIRNFRPKINAQNFQEFGFSVENIGAGLTAAVFEEQDSVKQKYYPWIEKVLWSKFPEAAGVYIHNHNVITLHPVLLLRFY